MKSISYGIKHLFSKRWTKVALVALLLISPAVTLSGCGKQSANSISVGLVGSDANRIWVPLKAKLQKQGIHVKLVNFSDYTQPNKALQANEINVNAFQTKQYLDNYNKSHHSNLDPVAKSDISPFSIYSYKIHSLKQLKKGAKIAFPNDAVDEGRALHVLASAGLIKYKHVSYPTIKDITSNKKDLKFETLDAPQVPRTLKDVDAALINGGFAVDAKISPSHIIYHEKITKFDKPYINYIVTTKSHAHSKAIKQVIKDFQSASNAKRIKKDFEGYVQPAWNLKLDK